MASLHELRALDLFDGVTDEQLAALLDASEEVRTTAGDVVFRAGDPADFWWINLEGTLDLVRHVGNEDVVVGTFAVPGRWAGGFRAWDDRAVYLATGRASGSGRVLRVPAPALAALLAELPLVRHFLDGLTRTARSIEEEARRRGALVTLGTLSAGLAHELNNPAAAAGRAVDGLRSMGEEMLSSLGHLALSGITADDFRTLDTLRRDLDARRAPQEALVRSDREEELADWLDAHDVERAWLLAPRLAAGGVEVAWCERAATCLPGGALQAGIEWVAATLSAGVLLDEVQESTRRISELVNAVKSYSQLDRASTQQVDVTEGLESTLVMLGHKIRHGGVTVERGYAADVPTIEAYPGELNQVWTNLIDNAVDAMPQGGVLRLTTRTTEDGVEVVLGDTGTGMPPEVAQRAFEAFFTTKDVGRGTGLGLDIARRIVTERHGGEISIRSDATGTQVTVGLPARPPSR
jgi:signal transduction histidine kinase